MFPGNSKLVLLTDKFISGAGLSEMLPLPPPPPQEDNKKKIKKRIILKII